MTGYCRLCGLRLDAPPALQIPDSQRGQAELIGLGQIAAQHMALHHGQAFQHFMAELVPLQSLLFSFFLAAAAPVESASAGDVLAVWSLEEEREKLRAQIIAWLQTPEPVRFARVTAPDAPAGASVM